MSDVAIVIIQVKFNQSVQGLRSSNISTDWIISL